MAKNGQVTGSNAAQTGPIDPEGMRHWTELWAIHPDTICQGEYPCIPFAFACTSNVLKGVGPKPLYPT